MQSFFSVLPSNKNLHVISAVDLLTVSEKERVVNLGELIGKLPVGAASLTGLRDDRRNKVNPGMHSSVAVT